MEDSYGLIMKDNDITVGFTMGYFKQYDDIKGYTLEEILIAAEYQILFFVNVLSYYPSIKNIKKMQPIMILFPLYK